MKNTTKIKISVTGGGISYQGELDQKTAGQVIAICLSGASDSNVMQVASLGSNKSRSQAAASGESPSEYYNRHAPHRNPDKILTLAGYLKEARGADSFHPNEIKSLFRDVAEVLPANFTRDIKSTVKLGWIAPDHTKKKNFYVTGTGLNVLSSEFPKELKETVYKSSGRKKRKSSK